MIGPALQPTITQRVRAFLSEQGVSLRPWSSLDETYVELYALLNRQRDDPAFWEPLGELLHQIIQSTLDPERPCRLPAPEAELLASWDIDELIQDLRKALPGGEKPATPSLVKRFTSGLSTAVLGGFLVFGLAAAGGCSDDDTDHSKEAGVDAASDTAGSLETSAELTSMPDLGPWYASCTLDKTSLLWTTIDGSTKLSDTNKRILCKCFSTLSASWTTGLSDLFKNSSASYVALTLEAMVQCCTYHKTELGSDYKSMEADFISGKLCKSVPLYKGVSFPRR